MLQYYTHQIISVRFKSVAVGSLMAYGMAFPKVHRGLCLYH